MPVHNRVSCLLLAIFGPSKTGDCSTMLHIVPFLVYHLSEVVATYRYSQPTFSFNLKNEMDTVSFAFSVTKRRFTEQDFFLERTVCSSFPVNVLVVSSGWFVSASIITFVFSGLQGPPLLLLRASITFFSLKASFRQVLLSDWARSCISEGILSTSCWSSPIVCTSRSSI